MQNPLWGRRSCCAVQLGPLALDSRLFAKWVSHAHTGKTAVEPEVAIHRIWIMLTSCNVKSLGKVCTDLIRGTKVKMSKWKGQSKMPTKTLRITTRKTPCGEGSKTWIGFRWGSTSSSSTCTALLRLSSRLLPAALSQEWRLESSGF